MLRQVLSVLLLPQDDGRSWTRSNVIDPGGVGHHGGVTEATIEQLRDRRIYSS